MRKIATCAGIIIIMCISGTASAQVVLALLFGDKLNTDKMEFGLVVSPAITNITNESGSGKSSFNLALYFNIRPDNKLFLHIELVGKGSYGAKDILPNATGNDTLDHLFSGGSIERKIQTFGMPVLLRYRLSKLFFAEAGPQVNMRLKVHDIYHATIDGSELDYTVKTTDNFTLLDVGAAAGLFYKFSEQRKSMGVGIRYLYGLTDIYKTKEGKQVNAAWFFNLTIPIGTGKAQK
jgi:hypothetical protein